MAIETNKNQRNFILNEMQRDYILKSIMEKYVSTGNDIQSLINILNNIPEIKDQNNDAVESKE